MFAVPSVWNVLPPDLRGATKETSSEVLISQLQRVCCGSSCQQRPVGMTLLKVAGLPKVLPLPGGSYPMAGYWSQQYGGLALLPPAGTIVKGYLLQSSLGVR